MDERAHAMAMRDSKIVRAFGEERVAKSRWFALTGG